MSLRFEDWCLKFGREFDYLNSAGVVGVQCRYFKEACEADISAIEDEFSSEPIRGVSLELGFVESSGFGARSGSVGNSDFIGINIGVVSTLNQLFKAIFSVSDVFSMTRLLNKVDVPTLQPEPLEGLFDLGPFTDCSEIDIKNNIDLTLTCLRFLFHHELAHIWNGHAAAASTLKNAPGDIIRWAFEFDADSRASWALLTMGRFAFFDHADAGVPRQFTNFRSFSRGPFGLTSIELDLYRFVGAVYCMLRFTSEQQGLYSQHANHPSWADRIFWILEAITSALLSSSILPERALAIVKVVVKRCEQAIVDVLKCEPFDAFSKTLATEASTRFNSHQAKWLAIIDDVNVHLRGKNNPFFDRRTRSANIDSNRLALGLMGQIDADHPWYLQSVDTDSRYEAARLVDQSGRWFSFLPRRGVIASEYAVSQLMADVLASYASFLGAHSTESLHHLDVLLDNILVFCRTVDEIADNTALCTWRDAMTSTQTSSGSISYVFRLCLLTASERRKNYRFCDYSSIYGVEEPLFADRKRLLMDGEGKVLTFRPTGFCLIDEPPPSTLTMYKLYNLNCVKVTLEVTVHFLTLVAAQLSFVANAGLNTG